MNLTRVAIASDHTGVKLKASIIEYLEKQSIKVLNLGADNIEKTDYPYYAHEVVSTLLENEVEYGILLCATGIGMSIAANRYSRIRAALCHDIFTAERARMHNDANILVLGAKIVNEDLALQMVEKFFAAKFEGGRHSVRLSQLR